MWSHSKCRRTGKEGMDGLWQAEYQRAYTWSQTSRIPSSISVLSENQVHSTPPRSLTSPNTVEVPCKPHDNKDSTTSTISTNFRNQQHHQLPLEDTLEACKVPRGTTSTTASDAQAAITTMVAGPIAKHVSEPVHIELATETLEETSSARGKVDYEVPPSDAEPAGIGTNSLSISTQSPVRRLLPIHEQKAPKIPMSRNIDTLWQQIQRQRFENQGLQSKIHEARAMLRSSQDTKAVAEDALFRHISENAVLAPNSVYRNIPSQETEKTLVDLIQNLRAARDEYGPLEYECNQLEDQLKSQEFTLNGMEEEFYEQQARRYYFEKDRRGSQDLEVEQSVSGSSLVSSEAVVLHALTTAFLRRLGDLDQLQEELIDLENEKHYLTEEKALRSNLNLALSKDNQLFLDNFDSNEKKLKTTISATERDVARLREQCLAKGFIDENDEATSGQFDENEQFQSEDELDAKANTSEYVKYPKLLPRSKHGQDLESTKSESDLVPEKMSNNNRINQWLLEQLRDSPLEVQMLASTFEEEGGQPDDGWQVWVLHVWFADETVQTTINTTPYSNNRKSEDSNGSLATQPPAVKQIQHKDRVPLTAGVVNMPNNFSANMTESSLLA